MKVTKGKHGETRELKLGEVEIVSHVYWGYQRLHLKMKNCSVAISPRGIDIDGDESTSVSITVDSGHPIIKCEGKHLWLKIYQKRKTEGIYAGIEWEPLDIKRGSPNRGEKVKRLRQNSL